MVMLSFTLLFGGIVLAALYIIVDLCGIMYQPPLRKTTTPRTGS
jgi:hypothetical protein